MRLHLDVHSFPTRRSSDLIEIEQYGPERVEHCLEGVGIGKDLERIQATNDRNACNAEGETSGLKDGISDGLIEIFADPDRKSTRLNSSHQIISYAVFCLKK